MLKVQSLHIYPVKSGQGIDLQTAQARPRGLAGDRRFMIVDASGKFITQRQKPELAMLKVQMSTKGLSLSLPNGVHVEANLPKKNSRKQVTVWRSDVDAALMSGDINTALSTWLGAPVSLVYMDEAAVRTTNVKWAQKESLVSFADGYPVLVVNAASLTALNEHIKQEGGKAISMARFRPNIVIEGAQVWAENDWKTMQIGGAVFDLVKPCARCIMTSIDQKTGAKKPKTALKSLKVLNPSDHPDNPGVIFGINAVVRQVGTVSAGDTVKVEYA